MIILDFGIIPLKKFFISCIYSFDSISDLINSDKFYCTELVYKSFLKAGLDLSGGNLDTLLIPIGKNPFLLPRTILKSALLKKVNITKTKEE